MSAVDRKGWVTVEYDGDAGRKAGVPVFRTKGLEFVGGQRVELSPQAARAVIDAAPSGAMKVVSGTPAAASGLVSPLAAVSKKTIAERAPSASIFAGAQSVPSPAPKPNPVRDGA